MKNRNDEQYKRIYHPLTVILYRYNMLTQEQIRSIPKSTRHYWDRLNLDYTFGQDWAEDYVTQFEDIKSVFESKYLYRTMRLMCKMNERFNFILQQSNSSSKILRTHSSHIVHQVEHLVKSSRLTLQQACKFQGISTNWFYRQKQKIECPSNTSKKCFLQFPNQLTVDEVQIIETTVTAQENERFNLTTLYYKVLNEKRIFCAKSTFSKYAKLYRVFKRTRTSKKKKEGFRAKRPFEWLHIDITYVPTVDSGMQKVVFVKDNFSRALLHYKSTSGKAGSEFIRDALQEAFEKHNLFNATNPINILSDGGPENKGHLLDWINGILAPPEVLKITAKTPEFPFSNSMSESTHSIYKSEFLKKKISFNEQEHLLSLEEFMPYYNNERYPGDLLGLTVLEVLDGAIPDKHKFKEQIAQAKYDRIQINKTFNCSKGTCVSAN